MSETATENSGQPPLRFVHASDLHLERPLGGVADVPTHLRDLFLDAPFEATAQVFETALSEGADALLLAGDVVEFDLVALNKTPPARPNFGFTICRLSLFPRVFASPRVILF